MGRAAVAIILSEAERRELEGLARRRKTAQGLARRARIVLATAEGLENKAIVERLGADANTVGIAEPLRLQMRVSRIQEQGRETVVVCGLTKAMAVTCVVRRPVWTLISIPER